MAGSDRAARIFTVNSADAREALVIQHAGAVTKVRFHPTQSNQLCTAAADKSVRLWDVRDGTQRAMGKIDVSKGNSPVALEWCGGKGLSASDHPHILSLTEQDGTVFIYDVRKLASANATTSSNALYSYPPVKKDFAESCVFSPDGEYLVADCTRYGTGSLRIWPWKSSTGTSKAEQDDTYGDQVVYYPLNGPIYAMKFSPNRKYLATGGADAVVGIWETHSMCCTHVVPRHTKFIRGLSFSHDSLILASSSEEESIDLANTADGSLIGQVNLSGRASSSSSARGAGGAEEIDFHPKEYLLACARIDSPVGPPPSPVTLAKVSVTTAQ